MREYVSLGSLRQLLLKPSLLTKVPHYLAQLRAYRELELLATGTQTPLRIYPCFNDDAPAQSAHSSYFYQDCWAAKQVFKEQPDYGVDLGSTVLLVGILSQFVPFISVDIRPLEVELNGLSAVQGSLLKLPFADNEVPCITTMCVLEHIGLGRYGDQLAATGTVDAVAEISRVTMPGGIVVYSVPVGRALTEFNAHRRFRYEQASSLFSGWELLDSCVLTPQPKPYVSESEILKMADPVACFCYRKPKA
jgi:SAM-dependent methyltransferase